MATGDKVSRGSITLADVNDATSLNAFITSNRTLSQIYSRDTNSYSPDWTQSPYLVLTPSVFMSGVITDQIGVAGRIKAGSVKWYKDGVQLSNVVGTTEFSTTVAPYSLTIKQNQLSASPVVQYRFEAEFMDPRTSLGIPFAVDISFAKLENAGALIVAIGYTPDGSVFINSSPSSLKVHCDFWRGNQIDNTQVSYKWGIKKPGVFANTTAALAATTGQKVVRFTSIDNVVAGSLVKIGSVNYTVESVNAGTKDVTMTSNITTAVSSGAVISCPEYDVELGVNWGIINATYTRGGITNYTTNEITVPDAAVLNYETFKCAIKDTDSSSATYNVIVSDIISLSDMSDPISTYIYSASGNLFKNGQGSKDLTAQLWRAGVEIDPTGVLYTYKWNKTDKDGVPQIETRQTKTITVLSSETNGMATFECEILQK